MFLLLRSDNEKTPFCYTAEEAFIKYSDMVFALAYSRCNRSYSDAQDITGEVFFRLVRRAPSLKSDEHLRAWLVRVTVNCSKSLVTNAWNRYTEAIPDDLHCEDTMCAEDDDKAVYNAVMSLPVNIRTAIHLFYYEEMSINEIASVMSAKPNTVKSYLHRGRERLRELLKEEVN